MEEKNDLIEKLKIALIYGSKSVDGKNLDGEVEKIYKDEDDTAHFFYMSEFLQKHFKDEVQVQESLNKRDINSIFYEIQKLGHIGFAESTSFQDYKQGILYIPKSISSKQKKTLKAFQEKLKKENYNIIELIGLERTEDGVLTGKQKQGKADILDEFVNEKQEDMER